MLTLYKASAGSGKTFTLTLEYIKLLLGRKNEDNTFSLNTRIRKPHSEILAVTFTNKATQQMKDRIISELSILSNNPSESDYIEQLKAFFRCDDIEKISHAAKVALNSLLFNFTYFNVSTIDSFFQLVLRTFASEIERPANFDIEMDEAYMISNGIATIIDSVAMGENKMLKNWMKNYMTTLIEEGRPFNLFNRSSSLHSKLVSVMKALINESYRIHAQEIDSYLENPERLVALDKAIAAEIAKITDKRSDLALRFKKELVATGELENFCHISISWLDNRIAMRHGEKLGTRMAAGLVDPAKVFMSSRTIKGVKIKCTTKPSEYLISLAGELLKYYDETQQTMIDLITVRSGLFYLGMLSTLTKVVKEYCRDNNMIMISDTNELLNRIIGNDIAPFIYERLGVRLTHFLIDEFQDTSRLQWLNMRPLLDESLACDHDNLIIGDEKQCIYRFRNSAPELLGREVKSEIDDETGRVRERGLCIEENCNWRSTPEIIRFNNSLFYMMGRDARFPSPNAYSKVIQEVSKKHKDEHGYVEVTIFKPSTDSKDSFIDKAIAVTLGHLKRMLKRYRAGDIAVLVRTKKEAKIIIDAMLSEMECGDGSLPRFNIISNDALKIGSSAAVKLLVNILRLVDSPESVDSGNEELGNRRFKSKNDTARLHHRFELMLNEEHDAGKALLEAIEAENGVDSILKSVIGKKCRDIISLTEHIISLLPQNVCHAETAFLTAFQDLVLSFQSRGAGDLHSFLEWWDNVGSSVALDTPESLDALTVTTIHKSKGIEYDCVIIPFANWYFVEDSGNKLFIDWYRGKPLKGVSDDLMPPFLAFEKKKALAESSYSEDYQEANRRQRIDNINLTYVAFTRAVKELIVVAQSSSKESEIAGYYIEKAITDMTPQAFVECRKTLGEKEIASITSLSDKLDEAMIFRFGTPEEVTVKDDNDDNKVKSGGTMPVYETCIDESLFSKIKVRSDEDFDPENARVEGDFMHEVMSKVMTVDDLEYACRLRAEQVNLPRHLAESRFELLKKMLSDKRVEHWFSGFKRAVTERSISIDSGKTKRPDRIVWTADGHIDVIDYKFGEPRSDSHYTQVNNYVGYLRQAGYDNVRGFLWYPLDNNMIITVDDGYSRSLF